jgi:hypothetical protein
MNLDPAERELRSRLLPGLLAEVGEVRRRRTARGRGLALAAMVTIALGVTLIARWSIAPPTPSAPIATAPPLSAAPPTIETIRTSPAALAAWSIPTDASALARAATHTDLANLERLDDESLLDLLASIGRPAGIVRTGGKTWLTADVADPRATGPG